ncbi:MAG: hypothetical protein AB1714_23785 [Acidobacteriota bacterium]
MRKHLPAVLATSLFLALGIYLIAISRGFVEMDEVTHYLQARYAPRRPFLYASVWARPLFTILYTLPAQISFSAARCFTLLIAALAAWIAYRLACAKGIGYAFTAVILTVSQLRYIQQCQTVMTEHLLALLLIGALYFWETERRALSCAVMSLTPLARPEGVFLGPLWFVLVLLDRTSSIATRARRTAILLMGPLLWFVISWAGTGSPTWFVPNFPWSEQARWGIGDFFDYTLRLPKFASWPILILGLAGIAVIRRYHLQKVYLMVGFLFLGHSVLRSGGFFGSAGYLRYLIPISPLLGIGASAGLAAILSTASRLHVPVRRAVLATLFAAGIFTYAISLRLYPIPFPPERAEAHELRRIGEFLATRITSSTVVYCADLHFYLITDRDPWNFGLSNTELLAYVQHDQLVLRELLAGLPVGSYVIYDDTWMRGFMGVTEEDLRRSGYTSVPTGGQEPAPTERAAMGMFTLLVKTIAEKNVP